MIKIKLTRKEYQQLYVMYNYYMPAFAVLDNGTSDGEDLTFIFLRDLLTEHMQALQKRIHQQLVNNPDQKGYTLKLQAPEAVAFYQVWQMIDTGAHTYGTVVLTNCIAVIDKVHVNNKILEG